METIIHTYRFDISNSDESEAYKTLCSSLLPTHRLFNVLADPRKRNSHGTKCENGDTVTLETEHLFSNQWNTPDERIFDWYEGIFPNAQIKTGHWLELTDEMLAIRRNTNTCGYCGHQEPEKNPFCTMCLDSEYLKETDLYLLRMLPIEIHSPKRCPLTKTEFEWLQPLYTLRQTTGTDSRNANKLHKQRKNLKDNCEKVIASALTERNGMLWLMDHGISINNCIYYNHTKVFYFGWRSGLSDSVKSELTDKLKEFPFNYEFKKETS